MADIEAMLRAEPLIGRLREVGKPFGRLRDAEILESSVIRALGQRVATPQGRQLMEPPRPRPEAEQRVTDDLLNSDAYQKTLSEVSEFRAALPSRHASSRCFARWPSAPCISRGVNSNARQKSEAGDNEQEPAPHPHYRETQRSMPPRPFRTYWVHRSRSLHDESIPSRSFLESSMTL